MPQVNGKKIEVITDLQAHRRGYLMISQVGRRYESEAPNRGAKVLLKKIVYVDGVYVGVAERGMKFSEVLEKFKNFIY